jgi:hypothetical protein
MSDVIKVNVSSGNLVYKLFIPSNYLSVDASEDEKRVADHYLSLLKQTASGERNAIVFPSDRDEQGNFYFDLQVVGVPGTEEAVQQMVSLLKNKEWADLPNLNSQSFALWEEIDKLVSAYNNADRATGYFVHNE